VLGIVVVSHGSADLLATHLARLAAPTHPHVVVVVENRRTAAEAERVAALAAQHGWDLVANPDNRGFGTGANQGVARAAELGCDAVVLVNPDLAVTGEVLDALAAEVAARPRTLVSPRVLRPDGRAWFTGGDLDLVAGRTRNLEAPPEPRSEGWLSGACLAASVAWWQELGGFAEDYFLYWEDVDLSYRATRAGGALLVRQDLTVVHDVGGTQGGKSPAYMRFNCRNRLLFAAAHLARPERARWCRGAAGYARQVLLRAGRRELLRRPGLVVAAVRGTLEGLAAGRG
jgi:GT2 family glycosyltransferase